MTIIEGKSANLTCSPDQGVAFLTDMKNFEHLLPSDKISQFKGEEQSCSFKIQSTATIALQLNSATADQIVFESQAPTPFRFTLSVFLSATETGTLATQKCEADLNPMLKMMVQKPLNKLFDFIAEQLETVLNR